MYIRTCIYMYCILLSCALFHQECIMQLVGKYEHILCHYPNLQNVLRFHVGGLMLRKLENFVSYLSMNPSVQNFWGPFHLMNYKEYVIYYLIYFCHILYNILFIYKNTTKKHIPQCSNRFVKWISS